jgi:DNA-binding winged helix-turn-helix (wHTH) protein/TolB-like protein
MDANPTRGYRFAGHFVDLAQQRLSSDDGRTIPLSGRAYDVLVYLVEHRDRVLSKDELLKAVWPRTIVEENNLNQAISSLRRALGDSRETPRCILTVAGRGYRFIASVVETSAGIASEAQPAAASASASTSAPAPASAPTHDGSSVPAAVITAQTDLEPRPIDRRRWLVGAVGALLAAGGGLLIARRRAPDHATLPRSIAVLPFKPLTKTASDEAVELGVAETLINRLSELPGVVVVPLSSVRRFGGVDQDPLAAGRALKVEAVVDGYIQVREDHVRLSARLLDVESGLALWADRFDERFASFIDLQDTLAGQLVDALAIQLTGEARERLLRRYTDDVEAWRLYLDGRYHWARRSENDLRRAVGFYEAAERRDPRFALAPAGLADAWSLMGVFNIEPPESAFTHARAAAERALALDDSIAEALAALGHVNVQYDRNWDAGARLYARAETLKPSYAMAFAWQGMLRTMRREPDEGLRLLRKAQDLEPDSLAYAALIGMFEYYAHDFEAAYGRLSRIVDTAPESDLARSFLAWVLLARGEGAQTLDLLAGRVLKAPGSFGHVGRAYALLGNAAAARAEMARLDALGKQGFGVGYDLALIHVSLGEHDAAIDALRRAVADHSQMMGYMNVDPIFTRFASDERFRAISRQVGLG